MQPIETIPRDGTGVVAYQANAPEYHVQFMGEGRWMITAGSGRLVMFSDEEMARFTGWESVADWCAREREKDLDLPIEACGRAPRVLAKLGINTRRQLIEWSKDHRPEDLYAVKGVGRVTVEHVGMAVWDLGVRDRVLWQTA